MEIRKETGPVRSVAVVGGGISGLSASLALARSGRFRVTLYEKAEILGGLCASVPAAGTPADRFYHVILPADRATRAFIAGLGLEGDIIRRTARAGFYGRGSLVPFASAVDFLRFPFLTWPAKMRLAWGILRTSCAAAPAAVPGQTAPEWLRHRFGRAVTENFWLPLLRSKLGDARDRTPAAFMAATIKRLFGARGRAGGRERMGCVRGGYAPVIQAAEKALRAEGVDIRKGTPVLSVKPNVSGVTVRTLTAETRFDRALLTVPLPEVLRLAGAGPDDPAWERFRQVEYLGIICVRLVLRRSLSPYYLINLLDPDLPFTGIVESTNILGSENAGGHHLVYLPKYVTKNDPVWALSDRELETLFLSRLKKVFPMFTDADILEIRTEREAVEQPLPSFGPPLSEMKFRSPFPGVFLAGTALIEDATVNNDAVLRVAADAVDAILKS